MLTLPAQLNKRKQSLKGLVVENSTKSFIAKQFNSGEFTITDLSRKYVLDRKTIRSYIYKNNNNEMMYEGNGGRPTVIDKISEEILVNKTIGKKRIQINEEEFDDAYNNELKESNARKNGSRSQSGYNSSNVKRNKANFEKKVNILSTNAEETTSARDIACANVRNSVSAMVAFKSQYQTIPRHFMTNFDACSSTLGDVTAPPPKAKLIGGVQQGKSVKVAKGSGRKGLSQYFIKTYAHITADGAHAPLVHCYADDNMPVGAIDCYEVNGIGVSGMPLGDPSWIVFCKTRQMNSAFYLWYWEQINFPFYDSLRRQHDNEIFDPTLDGTQFSHPVGTNCDGEEIQIRLFSEHIEFIEKLKQRRVVVDKPPGSTTEITQALDHGPIFITKNNYLKGITDNDIAIDWRFNAVSEVFRQHEIKHGKIPANHKRMGIYGTLRLSLAWQKTLNVDKARSSFALTGQYPFSAERVLQNCTTRITSEEETNIYAALEDLTQVYETNGELVSKDFNDNNIFNNDAIDGKSKEDLVMSRQRTVRLSHDKTQVRLAVLKATADVAKNKRDLAKIKKVEALKSGAAIPPPRLYKPRAPKVKKTS
eukprot:gene17284-23836_t